jgi:DNA-directed RNA polymerase subunit RPC12/RpoP
MPITFQCPSCDKAFTAPDEAAGQRHNCPSCNHTLTVPSAAPSPLKPAEPADDWDEEDAPRERKRYKSGSFKCPYCGSTYPPRVINQMSQAGLIVLIVLIFVCLPLFWIGLLMKEDIRICSDCGIKIG